MPFMYEASCLNWGEFTDWKKFKLKSSVAFVAKMLKLAGLSLDFVFKSLLFWEV